MANYKNDKEGRRGKAYRDKLKNDALKGIEEPERREKTKEEKKAFIELFRKMKNNST